jgi:hypothetical protein
MRKTRNQPSLVEGLAGIQDELGNLDVAETRRIESAT